MATLFSLLLLILCLTTTNCHAAPVDEVCAETRDPPLCIDTLGGPAARTDTLAGDAEIGFQTAGTGAIHIRDIFNSAASSTNLSPRTREFARQCVKLYDHIFPGLIATAHEAARVGRWADVVPTASQITLDIDECEKLFDDNSPAHEDTKEVRVAAEAIVIIAKILSQ